jgi:hypothetical protein
MPNLQYAPVINHPAQQWESFPPISPKRRDAAANFIAGRLLQNGALDLDQVEEQVNEGMDALAPQHDLLLGMEVFRTSAAVEVGEVPYVLLYPDSHYKHHELENPTIYYRSRSHAVWRAALSRSIMTAWVAKDMHGTENSTDAPVGLQRVLSRLAAPDLLKQTNIGMPYLMPFSQGARDDRYALHLMQTYNIKAAEDEEIGPILSDSDSELFTPEKQPDINAAGPSWVNHTEKYGEVVSTVFPSRDGKIDYVINQAGAEDGSTQYWLATAEVNDPNSKITSLGLPTMFPLLADKLLEPPIEYDRHTDRYGDRRNEQSGLERFIADMTDGAGLPTDVK